MKKKKTTKNKFKAVRYTSSTSRVVGFCGWQKQKQRSNREKISVFGRH